MGILINTIDHQSDQLWTDTFWDDVYFSGTFRLIGVSNPTNVQWPTNGGIAWRFSTGNEILFGQEMPHWWKLGTNGKLHVHWTPQDYGTAENGNDVGWKIDMSVCAVNAVMPSVTTYTLTAATPNQNNGHLIQGATAEVDLSALDSVSAWISGRVYRDAGADTWSSGVPAEQPYLTQAGMHLQIDRPGSRWEYEK